MRFTPTAVSAYSANPGADSGTKRKSFWWVTGFWFRQTRPATNGWMKFWSNINQNKIWWRLADIILLRAECRARLGGEYIAGAIEDLNTIRRRANAKLYSSSEYGGDLRYAIFKEREKELLMEGYRYYDVIRNGYVRTELEEGFQKASDQDFIEGCFFNAIESGAFNKNTLMRQNSYWLRYM